MCRNRLKGRRYTCASAQAEVRKGWNVKEKLGSGCLGCSQPGALKRVEPGEGEAPDNLGQRNRSKFRSGGWAVGTK